MLPVDGSRYTACLPVRAENDFSTSFGKLRLSDQVQFIAHWISMDMQKLNLACQTIRWSSIMSARKYYGQWYRMLGKIKKMEIGISFLSNV